MAITKKHWKYRKLKVMKVLGASIGSAVGIGAVSLLSQITAWEFIIPPFGATCVIAFVIPDSAFAQPRSIIGGHVLASFIGVLCFNLFNSPWWAYSLAVALSIAFMQLTRTLHPPAAADPVLIMMQGITSWNFIFSPVLTGSMVLVLIAVVFNRLIAKKHYPK